MLDFKICKMCEHCAFHKHEFDDDGNLTKTPYVECGLSEHAILRIEDDPPSECPFGMEHWMAMQNADPEIIMSLSGKAVKDKDEEEERRQ